MLAWLYRLFRLLFVYWKFRTNRIPAPIPPEERLREIDADLRRELAEWDRDFVRMYPQAKTFIVSNGWSSRGMVENGSHAVVARRATYLGGGQWRQD